MDEKLKYLPVDPKPDGGWPGHTESLTEFAGRLCYQSWEKKNPATQKNADYVAHIIAQGHLSILEHSSATLYVQDVSRAFLAEITRHRHLSFSVISQRYCAPDDKPVIPPAIAGDHELVMALTARYEEMLSWYNSLATELISKGLKRKQAREAARAVLPNMTPVEMVVTGNFRAWREVIQRRIAPAADAEIQQFARMALTVLSEIDSAAFADLI
ncbi:FAD-dependent thymidylate synthase [Nonomuraea sp. SYSU D8015]|uniref:FAD-dependent thymidylate synthase n=1 Tax=Nonomuraea sp. SYSU D8015 TaxID=2593644 RepID=UPI001CB6BAD8|nr:FAD-dependent thymidylate synthase [Nonomuraea sp. SYSU D8015]